MNIPLVSAYKVPFILHRISSTFFGGFELLDGFTSSSSPSSPPSSPSPSSPSLSCLHLCCSVRLLARLTLYLAPAVVGVVACVAIDVHLVEQRLLTLLSLALLDFSAVLALHWVADHFHRESHHHLRINNRPLNQSQQSPSSESPAQQQRGRSNSSSLQQLIQLSSSSSDESSPNGGTPEKDHQHRRFFALQRHLNLLLLALIAGTLLSLMTALFAPSKLAHHFDGNLLLASATFVTGWFTFTVAHHSLTLGPPPEPAAYSMAFFRSSSRSSEDLGDKGCGFRGLDLDRLNRPAHLLLPLALLAGFFHGGSNQAAVQLLTTFIALLPLLWLLGVVPPLTSTAHLFLETANGLLMGGSGGGVSQKSLAASVLLPGGAVLLAHFFLTSSAHFLLICSLVGFLASHKWAAGNWEAVVGSVRSFLKMVVTLVAIVVVDQLVVGYLQPGISSSAAHQESSQSESHHQQQQQQLSAAYTSSSSSFSSAHFSSSSELEQTLTGALLLQLALISLAKHSQRVYLFNWIKNPLDVFLSRRLLGRLHSNGPLITTVRVVLHCVLPLTSLLLLRRSHARLDLEEITDRLGHSSSSSLLLNLLVFRLFRHLWSAPMAFAAQLVALPLLLDNWLADQPAVNWPTEVKHLLLTWFAAFAVDALHKLYLVVVLLWASVFLKKQRLGFSWLLFVFNIVIFPANLAIIFVSALLRAPILPLFTLPIYLLSFPRPLQFWSTTPSTIKPNENESGGGSGAGSSDAAYYHQLLPRLTEALRGQRLLWDFTHAGEFLLARYEDRLLWLQVLESGHNYVTVQAKGLELQETSCHAIEASAIDHILEMAFGAGEEGGHHQRSRSSACLNSHFLYTVAPVMRLPVKTYSDARAVLTGIIDSPETFHRLKALFCQVLIWLLLRGRVEAARKAEEEEEKEKSRGSKISGGQNKKNGSFSKKNRKNAVADLEANQGAAAPKREFRKLSYEVLQPTLQWSNWSYQYSRMRGSLQTPSNGGSKRRSNLQSSLSSPVNGCTLEWFQEALKVHEESGSESGTSLNVHELTSLNLSYRSVASVCYGLLFNEGTSATPSSAALPTLPISSSASHAQTICQIFNGELPVMSVTGGRSLADNPGDNTTNTSAASDIDRKFFEANGDLLAASIRAAQYATKVAFDSVIFGATEPPTTAELAATLQDFDADWHFGSSSKAAEWQAAVIAEKGHLFSVGKDLVKENYTSHLLTLQSLDVAICSLNRATIEAIWSSLSLELFYLTNDDEERYSIQAHQIILRNLTVQAADPPLGYPLYASEPIIINHLT